MMLRSKRNRLFEEKSPLIDLTMGKHNRLIQGYRLCREDIRQELALRMLESLDRYNAVLCPNLEAWLMKQLRYALLHQTMPSKRFGIPYAPADRDFRVVSLDECVRRAEPSSSSDNTLELWDEIDSLPSAQRDAVRRLLRGSRLHCTNKALQASRRQLRQSFGAPGTRHRFKKE